MCEIRVERCCLTDVELDWGFGDWGLALVGYEGLHKESRLFKADW